VLADVYERDLALVAAGRPATIRVPAWPDRAFAGTVAHVGDVVDPATRTVKVRVDVDNPQRALKPEMFARVTLAAAPGAPALSIPSEALLADGPGSAVIVALGGGRFEKRAVESGPEHDGRVRVLSGLRDGEQVVVDGAIYLRAAIEGM
jgi:RND family efflux transporter MFP subunit